MADFKTALKKVLKWEGGFVDDPDDMGGRTNKGITQKTYNLYYEGDVKYITDEQVETIYRVGFWKRIKGDDIQSQKVAELLFDYAVNSGVVTASKKIQALVGVVQDGKIGSITVEAINKKNPDTLFNELYDVRVAYYKAIVARRPNQQKFLKGWLRRLKSYKDDWDK